MDFKKLFMIQTDWMVYRQTIQANFTVESCVCDITEPCVSRALNLNDRRVRRFYTKIWLTNTEIISLEDTIT